MAHVALYAVLGALITRSLSPALTPLSRIAIAVLIAVTFGALDEWHQQFIPGRAADMQDWCADASGAIAGSFLAFAGLRREIRS